MFEPVKIKNELAQRTNSNYLASGRRGSNPRRPAWEAGILPLNYSRSHNLLYINILMDTLTYRATHIQQIMHV